MDLAQIGIYSDFLVFVTIFSIILIIRGNNTSFDMMVNHYIFNSSNIFHKFVKEL